MSSTLLFNSFIKGIGRTSGSITILGLVGSLFYIYAKSFKVVVSIDNQTQTESQTETESQLQTESEAQTESQTQREFQTQTDQYHHYRSVFDRLT